MRGRASNLVLFALAVIVLHGLGMVRYAHHVFEHAGTATSCGHATAEHAPHGPLQAGHCGSVSTCDGHAHEATSENGETPADSRSDTGHTCDLCLLIAQSWSGPAMTAVIAPPAHRQCEFSAAMPERAPAARQASPRQARAPPAPPRA